MGQKISWEKKTKRLIMFELNLFEQN